MTKEQKEKASRRAKASWRNGPLSKWRKNPVALATHRLRALAAWAPGGELREWLRDEKSAA